MNKLELKALALLHTYGYGSRKTIGTDAVAKLMAEFAVKHNAAPKRGTPCDHPLKSIVVCEEEGIYWCNKCEEYVYK